MSSRPRAAPATLHRLPGPTPTWIDEALAGLPPLLTAAEATTVLRTSRRNLHRLVMAGRIQALRATESGSSRVLIPRAALEKYLRSLEGT